MTRKRIKVKLEDIHGLPPAQHEDFETEVLGTDTLLCTVPIGGSVVSIMFDPSHIRAECKKKIEAMIDRACRGERIDMASPVAGTFAVVGKVEMRRVANNLDQAYTVGRHMEMAWRFYMDAIISRLEELPEQLFMQVMLATITEMDRDGTLKFAKGDSATKMWDSYLDSFVDKIKGRWNKPKTGPKASWSEMRRRVLLEYYEARLANLTEVRDIYEAHQEGDWLTEVGKKYPKMKIRLANRVKFEEPEHIARELTIDYMHIGDGKKGAAKEDAKRDAKGGAKKDAKRDKTMDIKGGAQFDRQLTIAQKERTERVAEREAALNARVADARHMYTIEWVEDRIKPINLSFDGS